MRTVSIHHGKKQLLLNTYYVLDVLLISLHELAKS